MRAQEETISLSSDASTWLSSYESALKESALGSVSRNVVIADSIFIADRAAPSVESGRWRETRTRSGAVMGAVQSGKTASMVGVLARCLDNGVNVAVVLSGTRTALWKQTLERLFSQLDRAANPLKRRILIPNPRHYQSEGETEEPRFLYAVPEPRARLALERARPIIFVAMKQVDHLQALSQTLHRSVFPAARAAQQAVRLLVIDDEADDSSIADEEPTDHPATSWTKQVPRRILDLWEGRSTPGKTVDHHVFATYIAYTATPQANFLQDPQNPLAPRDFVAALRTPGSEGSADVRSLTYRVPEGLRGWYTGSDIYYGKLADTLCVVHDDVSLEHGESGGSATHGGPDASEKVDIEAIADAVRAYLVGAAVWLDRDQERVGPASAFHHKFATAEEAKASFSPPSSMLIHPSSATVEHFNVWRELRRWWSGEDEPATGARIKSLGVTADLAVNMAKWETWVESYRQSSALSTSMLEITGQHLDRSVPSWDRIRKIILEELVPAIRIEVINSHPDADDAPSFEPQRRADGSWAAPVNHASIFVSGNVMARGLTLAGLLTTLFTRSTRMPLADTQMQMQRWFGYRGAYIDLCRVFLSRRQLDLFIDYAEADRALRGQILAAMEESEDELPSVSVLQGAEYKATGKVSGLKSRPLSPGRRPFVRHLNPVGEENENLAAVGSYLLGSFRKGQLSTSQKGLVSTERLSLSETATLLDGLRYVDHGSNVAERNRWKAVERQLGMTSVGSRAQLYRAPCIETDSVLRGSVSPYSIGAYLRLWELCLDRHVPGLWTDENPGQRWSLLNLDTKAASQPRFRVGLRFGDGKIVSAGPLGELGRRVGVGIRTMNRKVDDDAVDGSWGSRGYSEKGYSSDELFDYLTLGEDPSIEVDGTRHVGADGLVLFLPIDRHMGQCSMAVGLSIPAGGPVNIEAIGRRSEWHGD